MDEVITTQDAQKFLDINPEGDAYILKSEIINCIGDKDSKGNFVDLDYLLNKYTKYMKYWQIKNAGKEEKYIGKNDKLASPYTFLSKRMYIQEFKISTTSDSRMSYIFGSDIEEITNKYKQIYKK